MFEFLGIISIYYIKNQQMQLWQCCLLVTAKSLYMFRTLSALDILTGYTSSRPMTRTSGCYYSF